MIVQADDNPNVLFRCGDLLTRMGMNRRILLAGRKRF